MNKEIIQSLIKFADELDRLGLVSEAAEVDKVLQDHVKTIEEKIEEGSGSYSYPQSATTETNMFSNTLDNIKADIIRASKQPGSQISQNALLEIVRIIDENAPRKIVEPNKDEIFAKQTGVVIGQTIAELMRDIEDLGKEYEKASEIDQPKIEKEFKHARERLISWEKKLEELKTSDPKSHAAVVKYIEQKRHSPLSNVLLLPEKRKG